MEPHWIDFTMPQRSTHGGKGVNVCKECRKGVMQLVSTEHGGSEQAAGIVYADWELQKRCCDKCGHERITYVRTANATLESALERLP